MTVLLALLVFPGLFQAPVPRLVDLATLDPVRGAEQAIWPSPAEPPLPEWPRRRPPVEIRDPGV